jgi:hypothetical protein
MVTMAHSPLFTKIHITKFHALRFVSPRYVKYTARTKTNTYVPQRK